MVPGGDWSSYTSFRSGREYWWSYLALEMEQTAAIRKFRMVYHLPQAAGRKALSVSETTYETNGLCVHNPLWCVKNDGSNLKHTLVGFRCQPFS